MTTFHETFKKVLKVWLEKKKCKVDEVVGWVEDYGTECGTFDGYTYHYVHVGYLSNGENKTFLYYGTLGNILDQLLKVEV